MACRTVGCFKNSVSGLPWSTATETTRKLMGRPKARQARTLAVAEPISRLWEEGLDTEPDHNALKRIKASTSPDRHDGGAAGTRTPGLVNSRKTHNTSDNHNRSKQPRKTSNERNSVLLARARGLGLQSHPNARSAGRTGTPGQCERTESAEPSKRPVCTKRGLPGTA